MKWVTLVVWLITAIGGFTLLGIWLQRGGMGSPAKRRFSKALPWLHGLLGSRRSFAANHSIAEASGLFD